MPGLALKDLYIEELQDLYDAENRLVKTLPKLAKAADSAELRAGFEEHLEQTKGHVERLRQIFENLGEKPSGKKCQAMIGLIKEGEEMLDEEFADGVGDAALISAAQRVEHYEIAAYGCVKTWAVLLGESEAHSLLEETLTEEKEADRKLTELSLNINMQAKEESGEGEEMGSEDEQRRTASALPSRAKSRKAGA